MKKSIIGNQNSKKSIVKKSTYKKRILDKIREEINKEHFFQLEVLTNRIDHHSPILIQLNQIDHIFKSISRSQKLNYILNRILDMSTREFTPKRFPSSKFLSIKLEIPEIINKVYEE